MGESVMEKDVVSIMVPCYNGERFLEGLFHTILQQTYKKIQVVFADDGSVDRTREIAEIYYPQFEQEGIQFKYLYQRNGGLASAINLALPHVTGEYCMWFDVDDFMSVDHIERKVNYLQEHLECDVVMCTGYMYNERDLNTPISTLGEEKAVSTLFEDVLLERRRCTQGLYMVRTEVLMEVLPDKHIYDANRRMGQNMQLLLPVTLRDHVGYIKDKLFHYIVRDNSLSHTYEREIAKQIAYMEHGRDIREHVLDALPISKNYLYFLKRKLALMICVQKLNLLNNTNETDMLNCAQNICMEYIDYAHITENLNKRNIVIWGKCEYTDKITFCLERYASVHVTAFIESNINKCDGKYVLYKENISPEDMYLIIPLEYHEDIIDALMKCGFVNHRDFFYPKYDLREVFEGKKIVDRQSDISKDKMIYEYPIMMKYLRNKVNGWSICDFLADYKYTKIALYAVTELMDLVIDDIACNQKEFIKVTICDTNADRFSGGHKNHSVIDANKLLTQYQEGNFDCVIVCSLIHENDIIKALMHKGISQNTIISMTSIIFSVE